LEAVPCPDGLQSYDLKGAATFQHPAKENFPEVVPEHERNGNNLTSLWWRRRKWLIIGSVIALLVIIGAVVGGVVGSRSTHASSASSSGPGSGSSTTTGSVPSATAQTKHNIAAISYVQGGINNTRVYYQDNAGSLKEAAGSADSSSWANTVLPGSPKIGSALAVAVSRTAAGFPLVLCLYPPPKKKILVLT
jgi:hypothetical protein